MKIQDNSARGFPFASERPADRQMPMKFRLVSDTYLKSLMNLTILDTRVGWADNKPGGAEHGAPLVAFPPRML
jgi:hypothetical protein